MNWLLKIWNILSIDSVVCMWLFLFMAFYNKNNWIKKLANVLGAIGAVIFIVGSIAALVMLIRYGATELWNIML